jgi:hypothetical protein
MQSHAEKKALWPETVNLYHPYANQDFPLLAVFHTVE